MVIMTGKTLDIISNSTPAHFTPTLEDLLSGKEYRIYDTLLAVTLTLCTVVGLPGNLLSLIYFYSAGRRDFSNFIYLIVCAIDICSCVVHIPVTIALYNERRPGIFEDIRVCSAWFIVFFNLQRMSMFLVMLLSVSRSITLIYLCYKINTKFITAAFVAYTSFLISWQIIAHIFGGRDKWYGYSAFDVYCWRGLYLKPLSYIDQLVRSICVGFPPILIAISFTLVSYKLLQRSQVSRRNERKHKAVVTMAMFTALFLMCNLPCLLNNIMWFINKLLHDEYPGPIYSSPFLAYYSWVISEIVSTVLNASLNPAIYLSRINTLQQWVSTRVSRRTQSRIVKATRTCSKISKNSYT